jgi:hypothetical protein
MAAQGAYFSCFTIDNSQGAVYIPGNGWDSQQIRERKAHIKSKSGCSNCKALRVKAWWSLADGDIQLLTGEVRREPPMRALRKGKWYLHCISCLIVKRFGTTWSEERLGSPTVSAPATAQRTRPNRLDQSPAPSATSSPWESYLQDICYGSEIVEEMIVPLDLESLSIRSVTPRLRSWSGAASLGMQAMFLVMALHLRRFQPHDSCHNIMVLLQSSQAPPSFSKLSHSLWYPVKQRTWHQRYFFGLFQFSWKSAHRLTKILTLRIPKGWPYLNFTKAYQWRGKPPTTRKQGMHQIRPSSL